MKKILIALSVALALLVVGLLGFVVSRNTVPDLFAERFEDNCSSCHGIHLEGTSLGPALVGVELQHGDTVAEIATNIANGFPDRGMPAWSDTLEDGTVQSLAIYVSEQRANRPFADFKVDKPLTLPTDIIETEKHSFRVEVVATGLDPLPFSVAPLPDGRFLVTEKTKGLRFIEPDGTLSQYIEGTPQAFDDGIELGPLEYGLGWLMDVAIHPDYAENGWVYLHYGDRCEPCGEDSFLPVTMNTLVRAHIRDGQWLDQETIWQAQPHTYSSMPDLGAGGRIAFDKQGHVFISVGIKGPSNYEGIQDLSLPYGKVHRVNDDGSIPTDNPYIDRAGVMPSIWSYGHRSPQGLEYHMTTDQLWGTEMGPRGGDEVNWLRPGRNFGWPLYSKGLDYDGSPVEYGKDLGIEFDLADIEQPIVDLTPSPAVSSFIIYGGNQFGNWRDQFIIGSLKATQLYRMVFENNKLVHMETLLSDFARIRDVEMGYDGNIYLLLEHKSGGQLVRLTPADAALSINHQQPPPASIFATGYSASPIASNIASNTLNNKPPLASRNLL